MAERRVVLETPNEAGAVGSEANETLGEAQQRAAHAEAELARLKGSGNAASTKSEDADTKRVASPSTEAARASGSVASDDVPVKKGEPGGGVEELRKDSMMAHLLDSLDEGKDIGHYGRLVFAMVARHFMPHAEVVTWLTKDADFAEEDANVMLRQVEGRDYNPPRRARILEWQREQEFPILPHPDDPDCGNLYRNLKFPEAIYSHIGQYQEQKAESESDE